MPLLKEETYTVDDIYALPEGERAELIDGKMYNMAPPNTRHQEISIEVSSTIRDYIRSNKGKCKVFAAPFAVFLNMDDKTYVEPDISVICDTEKIDDRGCNGAPDWIIEIVSPSSQRMDYSVKLFKYRSAGVQEYWIIDPGKEIVTVYKLRPEEDYGQYTFADDVPSGIYNGLSIKISDLL